MTAPRDRDMPPGPTGADAPRRAVATEYKFSHVTTQRYLPTPGGAPGWLLAQGWSAADVERLRRRLTEPASR